VAWIARQVRLDDVGKLVVWLRLPLSARQRRIAVTFEIL
jgi:hypothetical protein